MLPNPEERLIGRIERGIAPSPEDIRPAARRLGASRTGEGPVLAFAETAAPC